MLTLRGNSAYNTLVTFVTILNCNEMIERIVLFCSRKKLVQILKNLTEYFKYAQSKVT